MVVLRSHVFWRYCCVQYACVKANAPSRMWTVKQTRIAESPEKKHLSHKYNRHTKGTRMHSRPDAGARTHQTDSHSTSSITPQRTHDHTHKHKSTPQPPSQQMLTSLPGLKSKSTAPKTHSQSGSTNRNTAASMGGQRAPGSVQARGWQRLAEKEKTVAVLDGEGVHAGAQKYFHRSMRFPWKYRKVPNTRYVSTILARVCI